MPRFEVQDQPLTGRKIRNTLRPTMEVLDTVRAVLAQKGTAIWSVTPDVTVFDAIALMAEHNIGAVLVMENEQLVGLLSERDYTRKVILKGKLSKETRVRDIMSPDVTTVGPLDTVEHCMHLMTDKRVRHLPVVDDGQVVGVVSIGNLVNWIIKHKMVLGLGIESKNTIKIWLMVAKI